MCREAILDLGRVLVGRIRSVHEVQMLAFCVSRSLLVAALRLGFVCSATSGRAGFILRPRRSGVL